MEKQRADLIEELQKLIAGMIATAPAGQGLSLIGGVRFRLLDASPRMSVDIDYHWDGSLTDKQQEVTTFLRKKVLPEVKRKFGYEGTARPATGPVADSAFTKVIELAFYPPDIPNSRIEMPVDITRIECADKPVARTHGGIVYLTVSDTDMIESKIVALMSRVYVEARDILDIFLFENLLSPRSAERIVEKLSRQRISRTDMVKRIESIMNSRAVHVKNLREIMASQLDTETVRRLREGGDADAVFERVMKILYEDPDLAKIFR